LQLHGILDHQRALKSCCTSHRIKHRACIIIQLHRNPTLSFNSLTHIHSGHITTRNAHIAEAQQHLCLHSERRAHCTSTHRRMHKHYSSGPDRAPTYISLTLHNCTTLNGFTQLQSTSAALKHNQRLHITNHTICSTNSAKIARTSLQPTLHHHHLCCSTNESSQSLLLQHYCITPHHFISQREALCTTHLSRTMHV
jgi:hypothetical protein